MNMVSKMNTLYLFSPSTAVTTQNSLKKNFFLKQQH